MTWGFSNGEMCWTEGVAKKGLLGDGFGNPLAKNPFSSDGGKGRFVKAPA